MNFVAVAIVSAIVLGHPFNKSRLLIGLNCILLCLNNSSQITESKNGLYFADSYCIQFVKVKNFFVYISICDHLPQGALYS